MNTLTNRIKAKALELGFSKVGVARAEKLSEEGNRLEEWLNRGYQASMSWMANNIEKRIDPTLIVSNARSVVSVALNYYHPFEHSPEPDTGKISRYAWGDDYHEILQEKLKILLEFIKQVAPSANGRYYVDTGPVMDKVWAQRAGIGWQGKHTNVITQEYGSWIFLGEIILDIDLEYDSPATDHCGDCILCIEACPTDAINQPYVVDSNKCISYLTIEHKGEIAEELGEHFERWLYGCDICQDVCPWNHKFSEPTPMDEFAPREFAKSPTVETVLELTQEQFSKEFKNSPIKRTKLAGLKRNAGVLKNCPR